MNAEDWLQVTVELDQARFSDEDCRFLAGLLAACPLRREDVDEIDDKSVRMSRGPGWAVDMKIRTTDGYYRFTCGAKKPPKTEWLDSASTSDN